MGRSRDGITAVAREDGTGAMDFYEVLGVRKSAGAAEVRRAYQKRARQLHPDLNPGDPVAADLFRAVSLAFEVLSDPLRRAQYDRGDLRVDAKTAAPEVDFAGFDFSAGARLGAAGFRELFAGVLSSEPKGSGGEPTRGEDLEQTTRLTFEESLKGASRRIHLVRADACPVCGGEGGVAYGPVPCSRCQGAGRIRTSRGHMIFTTACADCGATGSLTRRPCQRCSGEGRVIHSEWIDVEIPAGAGNGTRLRVPDCGNAGRRGGPHGDFVLAVEVEAHPQYRREGDDLHSTVDVSMTQAALGGHVEVPTPDGPVNIEIPAGTQTGQRFRLRKRGVPTMGGTGRGDLFVEARVWVPAVTDARSRELLQEVARLHPEEPSRASSPAAAKARR
jgi:molecular chaperone DnaJ